jgi:ParB family chromosome partitioning protein
MTGGRRFNLDPSRFSTVAMTDDHRREVRRTTAQAANHTRSLVMVALDDIAPTPEPFNSRTQYDDASIGEIEQSIRRYGVLQPILIRPIKAGEAEQWEVRIESHVVAPSYVLVAGNRRYRGAKRADLTHIPCMIRDVDEEQAFAINLVENVQRKELSNAERLRAIGMLADRAEAAEAPLSLGALAEKTGLSKSTLSQWIRITKRESLREVVERENLDIGRAMRLVSLDEAGLAEVLPSAASLTRDELDTRVRAINAMRRQQRPMPAPVDERRILEMYRLGLNVTGIPSDAARAHLVMLLERVTMLLAAELPAIREGEIEEDTQAEPELATTAA